MVQRKARNRAARRDEQAKAQEMLRETLELAIRLHQQDRLEEAESIYRQIREVFPANPDALHYLGVICHQRGDDEQALQLIEESLQHDPHYFHARINLGNIFKQLGRIKDAEQQYLLALHQEPDNPDALNNLGTVLRAQNKLREAIEAFAKAVAGRPDDVGFLYNQAGALRAAGKMNQAIDSYRRAIELEPTHPDVNVFLGRALYTAGRIDEAGDVYRRWLEAEPDNPIARHMMASCSHVQVPERCSDDYVRETFDGFADSFDAVLYRLGYRAPELIAEIVRESLPPPQQQFDVLDGGCGTGLCGPLIKSYARRLEGLDLSEKMIQKARKLKVYDELTCGELTQRMQQQVGQFDVVILADTLVYFGDLGPVLQATRNCLRDNGYLFFTSEFGESEHPYQLHPHGRYSHCRGYIVQVLEETGFQLLQVKREVLRQEANQPVDGLVVAARRRN